MTNSDLTRLTVVYYTSITALAIADKLLGISSCSWLQILAILLDPAGHYIGPLWFLCAVFGLLFGYRWDEQ
jgi:hypothetical protein